MLPVRIGTARIGPVQIEQAHLTWANEADAAGVLHVRGSCKMPDLPGLVDEIGALKKTPKALDLGGLDALDSAGALVLLRLLGGTGVKASRASKVASAKADNYSQTLSQLQNVQPEQQILFALVAEHASNAQLAAKPRKGIADWVAQIGKSISNMATQTLALIGFFGSIHHCLWAIMLGRRKLRLTSVVHHIERTGLDAVPIICLLCFIFGAVVAYLSASAMKDFGAGILTVEIVSVSFLREFGVLLTAILVAGRSGSAFTAEIGSMNTREEIDAIKALSLDPIELLVVPRVCALVITLPMLAFLGVLSGIFGGALVGATSLDISMVMFFTRMQDNTELYYLWLGLLKAPVFAFLIAAIGCLEGLKVSGSAESVGLHTTSSVVQSIFLVIVVDALFAVLFMQLDL
jgi:phospholipid/cholesterol/gamma-HCH transport system permease protein